MSKLIGIYKITSPSDKVYIGQSWDIGKRFSRYKNCSKEQTYIQRSFIKYGYSAHKFEIIHELPIDVTQEIMDEYETFYWEHYKGCGIELMNIKYPGSRGKHSEETKKKIGLAAIGRKHSKESVEKRANKRRGIPTSDEVKKKLHDKNIGKRLTEETKKKIAESLKGNKRALGSKHSRETLDKRRLRIGTKYKKNNNDK